MALEDFTEEQIKEILSRRISDERKARILGTTYKRAYNLRHKYNIPASRVNKITRSEETINLICNEDIPMSEKSKRLNCTERLIHYIQREVNFIPKRKTLTPSLIQQYIDHGLTFSYIGAMYRLTAGAISLRIKTHGLCSYPNMSANIKQKAQLISPQNILGRYKLSFLFYISAHIRI